MINITFLTKYTSQSATSRYRSFFYMRQMLNKNYNHICTFIFTQ